MKLLLAFLIVTLDGLAAQEWRAVPVPAAQETEGFSWYRCFIQVPESWRGSRLLLSVRHVDDVDEAYFNGDKVGANGGMPPLFGKPSSDVRRPAVIDPDQVRFGEMNLIAFRVFNQEGSGGILEGPVQLGRLEDAIDLSGTWDFIEGDRREYAHWPNRRDQTLADYQKRHSQEPAGHRGIVASDKEGRERDMALVRERFEGNSNVHSNIEGKGKPLVPDEALAALTAGDDYIIDSVLTEPIMTQPLYVEFDARGRMWVSEYIQYPKPAGLQVLTWDNHLRSIFDQVPPPPPYNKPEHQKFIGRDKISIHEDTNGDGTFDSHKVFAEGLNIVTSTCQGNGGVWVMNPPYLLFFPDADQDDVPDADPVVHLSGFGLEDTHSVANSLKFGPDGWLYGCTGSTVTARVRVASKSNQSPFTFFGQNVWRYHPDTHDFELFAEGGWNTFGVDFDAEGRLFSGTNGSMQVVYFLQGAFYQKGFGKHGPHTNPHAIDYFYGIPIEGKHQRLVNQWLPYTGGVFPGHEGHLFGVNCLANRVAVVALEPDGSTFRSRELPAAIESEDIWFRPVHAALGPDGAIYVSDFYDARITHVDPRDNWDRDHGRIYRLRHREGKRHDPVDLNTLSNQELLGSLKHPNQWHRWTARRLLVERQDQSVIPNLRADLDLEALWTLHGLGALDDTTAISALQHPDLHVRLWTVRLLGDRSEALSPSTFAAIQALAIQPEPEINSQIAASLQRFPTDQALPLLAIILHAGRFTSDPYIPSQLWWALEKHVTQAPDKVLVWLERDPKLWQTPIVETKLASLLARRFAADPTEANLDRAAQLLSLVPATTATSLIRGMEAGLQGIPLTKVPDQLEAALARLWSSGAPDSDLIAFGLRLNSASALEAAIVAVTEPGKIKTADRLKLISRLAESSQESIVMLMVELVLYDKDSDVRRKAIHGLQRGDHEVIPHVLIRIATETDDLQIRQSALTVLSGRPAWAKTIVETVTLKFLPKEALTIDQLLVMKGHQDPALSAQIEKHWGNLRQPNELKQKRIHDTIVLVRNQPGDAEAGAAVFAQACAACHQLFGKGGTIGPELTGYERGNLEFLVTAVADPNLGVREEFELTTVTLRPREGSEEPTVLSGFVKALTNTQLTLQDLTGHTSVIATRDILKKENSPVSLMPDGLLDTLTDEQIRDLFAYLQRK
jgi:putative heme-binding domain-containing protein